MGYDLFKHCKFDIKSTATTDLFYLHGYKNDINIFDAVKYHYRNNHNVSVIACDAIGHRKRAKDGSSENWKQTVEEYNDLLNKRADCDKNGQNCTKKIVLVGHSMGGAMALHLATKNSHVTKAFSINGVFDLNAITDKSSQIGKYLSVYRTAVDPSKKYLIEDALPSKNAQCIPENSDRIYLAHNIQDKIIPIDQFYKAKEAFCIPEKNTILTKNGFKLLSHNVSKYDPKIWQFIDTQIMEK